TGVGVRGRQSVSLGSDISSPKTATSYVETGPRIAWQLDVGGFVELLLHESSHRPAGSPGHRCLDKTDGEVVHRGESSRAARELLGTLGIGAHYPVVGFERGNMPRPGTEFSCQDVSPDEGDAGAQPAQRARARRRIANQRNPAIPP